MALSIEERMYRSNLLVISLPMVSSSHCTSADQAPGWANFQSPHVAYTLGLGDCQYAQYGRPGQLGQPVMNHGPLVIPVDLCLHSIARTYFSRH